jgi:hypothetical protein
MDETTEWTTAQMQEEFEVKGFAMGLCVVRRKADNVLGSLTFHARVDDEGDIRRIYTGWTEDK